MLYNIVSLINASTWLICALSISAGSQSWLQYADHILLVLCIVLNIVVLVTGKCKRIREKLAIVIFMAIALVFLGCDIYFESYYSNLAQLL